MKSKVVGQIRGGYDKLMMDDYEENNNDDRFEKVLHKIPSEESMSSMLTEFVKIIISNIKLKKL